MSLSSELEAGGWAHQFFAMYLPGVTTFTRKEGKKLTSLKTKVQLAQPGQAATIGIAFDYRLRLHLGFETQTNVLRNAPFRMAMIGSGLGRTIDLRWMESMEELLEITPNGSDNTLARASVILAWLDQGFRGSPRWPSGMVAMAQQAQHSNWRWEDVASFVGVEIAEEVSELMRVAIESEIPEGEATCGPEFAGSRSIDGADADLIIDQCIYDVKTVADARRNFPKSIRQILGYVFLDWVDQYRLERIGMYYSRQGTWMTWPLNDLLSVAASSQPITVEELRDEFRQWAVKYGKSDMAEGY